MGAKEGPFSGGFSREGHLRQRVEKWEVGGLTGGKQVYRSVPKSTPNQMNHLEMEFLFSLDGELS